MDRPRVARFLFAGLVVVSTVTGTAGLRAGLEPLLGSTAPLILFLLPVIVSAALCGLLPGLAATLLGGVLGIVLFSKRQPTDPTMTFFWLSRGVPFWVVGACISLFADVMNRARLQAKQATHALAEARRRSDAAMLAGEVGTYYWDVRADRVYGDRNFVPIFGVLLDEHSSAPVADFVNVIHADDRDRVSREIQATLRDDAPFHTEYRITHPAGERWLLARGTVERDEQNRPVGWAGVVVDATARKRAEQQRAESEQQFRTLFSSMDEGYCIIEMLHDSDGRPNDYRFLLLNPAFAEQTGMADMEGRTMRSRYPALESHWFETYGRVAETGEPTRFTQEARTMGGRWFDVYAFRVGGPGSKRVAVLFANVTDRKRTEAELTATARQRDALLDLQRAVANTADRGEAAVIDEAAPRALAVVPAAQGAAIGMLEGRQADAAFLVDQAGAGSMAAFVGVRLSRSASLSGRCLDQAVPLVCDDVETDDRVDRDACRTAGIRSMLVVPILRSGAAAGVLRFTSGVPGAFAEADVLAAQLAVGAITTGLSNAAEAKALEALRHSEAQFRQIADTMPQLVWVTRPDGFHEYYNRRWYDYVGTAGGQNDGAGWADPLHPEDADRSRIRWRQSLETGEPYEIEYRFRRHDGVYRWFLGRALPVRDGAGKIVKWYGTCTDIDEQKRLQQQYDTLLDSERSARTQAEQAGRMKDDFLATVSHELRTPLSAIVGWSHLLAPDADKAMLAEGLGVIHRNAMTQSQLIEDILDVSRITSGRLRLKTRRVNLCEPVRAAAATVRTAADAKGVTVTLELSDGVDVIADPERLQQIFWNLIANAIKFTDRGGSVTVRCRMHGSHGAVEVTDTGRGIGADFLPYVFDRFRQADMTTTRRHGGLGLGLAIVRHLVELHGGRVSADSAGEGHGSTFSVELPIAALEPAAVNAAPSAPAPADAGPSAKLAGRRVLLIDDEPDALRVLQAMLTRHRVETVLAGSVSDAVGVLSAGLPFDAVLSDIGLPGEDGYVFIRRLRAMEAQRNGVRLPAVALTAYTRATDRASVLEAGFDRYLSKPVNPTELLTTLDDVMSVGRRAPQRGVTV